ncbi:vacuolar sorting-associated protein 16-like protein [Turdus rufiventris]|nr:vacuolar sorting-associated protein 16-like protein [Turdus rufiventris]
MDCYTANWNPLGEETFYRDLGLSGLTLPCRSQWKSGRLVHLGWTAGEDLLCIQEDGTVLVYNLFCEFKRHFSMGNEVLQNHVLEAQVFHTEFGTGVAILTGALRFSLATNIDDLKLRRLPEVPGLQKPPPCWAVLSQDRVTVVLLAMGQELFLLDNTSCSVVSPPGLSPSAGPFLHMAVSFTHRHLALFSDSGTVWMGTASLKAASFGKCFLDKFPPEGFVRMCQDLRVLNAIRDYQIGIPLTFTQYKQLTIEVLLDR